ncbi:4-hydroxyacetophenone monooxygenase, partial [Apiospora rasikravindrae]
MTAKESTPEAQGSALSHEVAGTATKTTDNVNGHKPKPPESQSQTDRFRDLELEQRYIDEPRKLRVVVVGAGLAGVIAGTLLPAKVPNIELTIFEKNADVGGTWFENKYPGVRCDIPAHVYQTSFEPNTQWSEEFAQGAEIREYWQKLAQKYGVYDRLKLSHNVTELDWDATDSVWKIDVVDLQTGEQFTQTADFVLTAVGRFNAWKLPDYPGLHDFAGLLRHTSNWDPAFDPAGKRVAVIGNGASGIQAVSHLHKNKQVARLDHYARNPTWIADSFAGDKTSLEPKPYPAELRRRFAEDPAAYTAWRKAFEDKYWRGFETWLRNSDRNNDARVTLTESMRQRLLHRPELLESLIPEFSPHCRRLTPGPGYLEAITADNTDYIQTRIARFTETGIETVDGKHREVDAIFCATGANIDMIQPFPIRGPDGVLLSNLWSTKADADPGFPYTYLGAATPGFPNLFFVHGPNAAGRSGSVPHSVEVQVAFFARVLRKAAREGIRTLQPSVRAADDFVEYCDAFFRSTVLTENCSSWYNGGRPGARIHGLWPGSGAHVETVLREPRWEDWEYTYLNKDGNRLMWYFGNGQTRKEEDPKSDMTRYVRDPSEIDLRTLHD